MQNLKRSAVCFIAVLGVFWLYKLTLAAWLVPPSVWTSHVQVVTSPEEIAAARGRGAALEPFQEHLFPPGAWERDKPMIVESDGTIFLLKGYTNKRDDKWVKLDSCTIIFRPRDLTDYRNPNKRVTILQAPQGADLEFDEPIDIGRNKAGRIKSGTFQGQITIRSTSSKPGADDALNIVTSDISINQEKMTTNKDVHGFLGKNEIIGTGLLAILLPSNGDSSNSRGPSIGGIETVELKQNVRMVIHPQQSGFLPGDRQSDASPLAAQKPTAPQPPVEIRCQGPFEYSHVDEHITFKDQVQLRRVFPDNQIDSMDAEWLRIEFARRARPISSVAAVDVRDAKKRSKNQTHDSNLSSKLDPTAKNSAVAKDRLKEKEDVSPEPELGNLEPSKVIAQGQPVVIRAPSSGMAIEAEYVEYNRFTGKVVAGIEKGRSAVHLRHNEQEYHGLTLVYEPGANNSLGNLAAQGPGWMKTTMPRGAAIVNATGANQTPASTTSAPTAPNIVEVKFQDSLIMNPDSERPGEHVISVLGNASIDSQTTGHIDGDKIYFWVKELPQKIRKSLEQQDQQSFNLAQTPSANSSRASRSMNVMPMRMLVLGEKKIVTFNAPQLTGRTKQLEVYFVNAGFESPLQNPNADPLREQQNLRVIPFRTSRNQKPGTREVILTAFQMPAASGNLMQNVQSPYVNPQTPPQFNAVPVPQHSSPIQANDNVPAPIALIAQNSQASSSTPPKYINDVSGHIIRLQILQTENEQKLQHVTIDTEARFRQVSAANSAEVTADMAGDHLEVLNANDPTKTQIKITGAPAVIKTSGTEMIGETVRVDYATNTMYVDGAGELNMQPSPAKNQTVAPDPLNVVATNRGDAIFGSMGNGPTKVKFPNGLKFDGERITIEGRSNPNVSGMQSRIDVVVTSRTERKVKRKPVQQNPMMPVNPQQPLEETMYETRKLSSPHIEVKLLSRINFQKMNGSNGMFGQGTNADPSVDQSSGGGMGNLGAQVHTMTCTQGVFLEVREDHENGDPERYSQFHALDLVLDRTTDQIFGHGPGEMVSYSRPNGRGIGLMPNPAAPATPPNGQLVAGAANPNSNEVDYMHIDFQRGFKGNTRNLEVMFDNNVVVIYGPVKGWSEKLDPNDVEKLTGNGFRLTSDQLIVSQSLGNVAQQGTDMDLQAVGNTKIESPTYTANAYRMTYAQAKSEVTLHGGRGDAVLYYYPKQGGDWSTQRAGTITFWPTTREVKIDNARQFEFSQPPSNSRTR